MVRFTPVPGGSSRNPSSSVSKQRPRLFRRLLETATPRNGRRATLTQDRTGTTILAQIQAKQLQVLAKQRSGSMADTVSTSRVAIMGTTLSSGAMTADGYIVGVNSGSVCRVCYRRRIDGERARALCTGPRNSTIMPAVHSVAIAKRSRRRSCGGGRGGGNWNPLIMNR